MSTTTERHAQPVAAARRPLGRKTVSSVVKHGLMALAGWLALLPLHAGAALMLHPTRIVFDKNMRVAQAELINNGSETVTYRISLVNRRMDEIGEFSDASPPLPGERFADEMLRYSPRQVVLAPGASQTLRIQLRKPADLPPGEYRSHLMFTQIAGAAPPPATGPSAAASGADAGLAIRLTPLINTSIPVIVRHGPLEATAALANLRVEPAAALLDIRREGERSLYGDLVVTLVPADGGSEQPLARASGVAVYVPNALRKVRIVLPPSPPLTGGTLHVVFQERPEDGGKPLAEARLPLR
jgi:P pilus assembly chaperone PapD